MKFQRLSKLGIKYLMGYKHQGIGLILTRKCNIDCSYCKIKDNSGKRKELTINEWKSIIKKFSNNKHMHFIFTGGEPLLYNGVYDLIDYASKNSATSLITNTLLLNNNSFPRLKNLDYLTFSCDTSQLKSNLTKNTLDKFNFISESSRKYNITPSVIITVTSKNTDEIPLMVTKASKQGISVLLSLIHSNEGSYDFRNHSPNLEFKTIDDFKKLEQLQNKLILLKQKGYKISESDFFIRNMINYVKGSFKIDCPAANPFFTIDCDGMIKPCHDIKATNISALEFTDYNIMNEQIKKNVPKSCNCYYDCYVNNSSKKIENIIRAFGR